MRKNNEPIAECHAPQSTKICCTLLYNTKEYQISYKITYINHFLKLVPKMCSATSITTIFYCFTNHLVFFKQSQFGDIATLSDKSVLVCVCFTKISLQAKTRHIFKLSNLQFRTFPNTSWTYYANLKKKQTFSNSIKCQEPFHLYLEYRALASYLTWCIYPRRTWLSRWRGQCGCHRLWPPNSARPWRSQRPRGSHAGRSCYTSLSDCRSWRPDRGGRTAGRSWTRQLQENCFINKKKLREVSWANP